MTDCNPKFFGAGLIALAFSVSTTPAAAQTCAVPPSCETLGFTLAATDCVGKTILKCPFDQNKIYCPSDDEVFQTYKLGDTLKINNIAVGKIIQLNNCSAGVTVKDCISRSSCTTTSSDYVYDSNSSTGKLYTWICKSTGAVIATNYTGSTSDTARTCAYSVSSCKSGGIVASIGTRSGTFTQAGQGCADITAGGLSWYLPTNAQLKLIAQHIGSFSNHVWDQSGQCGNSGGGSTALQCDGDAGNAPTCTCGNWSWCKPCSSEKYNGFTMGYYCVAAF